MQGLRFRPNAAVLCCTASIGRGRVTQQLGERATQNKMTKKKKQKKKPKKTAAEIAARDGKKVYIKSQLLLFLQHEGQKPTEARTKSHEADADYKNVRAKLAQLELDEKTGELDKQIEEKTIPKILAVKRALTGQGRKLAPKIALILGIKDRGKINRIQKIIDSDTRSIIEGFAK